MLGRAFVDDPVSIASFPGYGIKKLVHALTTDFEDELKLSLRRGYPIQGVESGKLVAAAVIYPPGRYPLPMYEGWLLLARSMVRNGRNDPRSWIKWLNEVSKLHPTEPHFYLEYLGVEPGCQGLGYGSLLVKHMTERADELGVGCYLENANPRNLPFYKRHGFSDIRKLTIIGIPTWLMWRPRNA